MKFTEHLITHYDTGAPTQMWVPESFETEGDNEHVEIVVDGVTRMALSGLIQLTETFTRQKEQRTQLRHDCGVFAYAWESGQTLDDKAFHQPGASQLGLAYIDNVVKKPSKLGDVQPGKVVFTEYAKPRDDDFLHNTPHFLVRATVDDQEPLYLSKFGSTGPVALSTLEQSMEYYPTRTIGIAKGFYEIEAPVVTVDSEPEA